MRTGWISFFLFVLSNLVLTACGSSLLAANTTTPAAAQSTQVSILERKHDSNPASDNSYDVHFIDSALNHHLGVVNMAEQALYESQSAALKELAQQTLTTAQWDINWLTVYREKKHPNAALMKDCIEPSVMSISSDTDNSFDQRYARAMIEHNQRFLTHIQEVFPNLGHEELKLFAEAMITTEEAEADQLKQFLK